MLSQPHKMQSEDMSASVSLPELLVLLIRVGSVGFGGGMATIALMEEDFVRRRHLIPLKDFVHGVGLGQLLGGFAVNVAAFIGYRLFGLPGALLSAVAFIAPSFLLTMVLSDLYFRYHAIPALQSLTAGLPPVVIGLILNASWSIGRRSLSSWLAFVIAAAAFAASVYRVNAALILIAAGIAGFFLPLRASSSTQLRIDASKSIKNTATSALALGAVIPASLTKIFVTFLKIGLVFFGGGFVLVPLLQNRLVTELNWLKPSEFLDGLAISNLTPGPIALIVAFAGFHLKGLSGALAATIGLFAPGFLLTVAVSQQYGRLAASDRAERFLAGVDSAVVGLIFNAAYLLGRSALVSWPGYALSALSFVLLVRFRWHPILVLAVGAVLGAFRQVP